MVKKLIATIAFCALPVTAMAADLPSKSAAPVLQTATLAPDWDGVYLGVSASHSLGTVGFKLQDVLELSGFGSIGYSAGALVGYNYTFREKWLAGLELGGEFSNNSAHAQVGALNNFARGKATTDQEATLSGRFGYLVSPTTLAYTSIGATAVHGKGSYLLSMGGLTQGQTERDVFYGVAFAAFGVETQLSGGWRGRFEYVTSVLKSNVYRDNLKVEVTPQIGTARLALIYGFGGAKKTAGSSEPAPSWTGPYLGGGAGRNQNISRYDVTLVNVGVNVDGLGAAGWSGSAIAGYNYQFNSAIVAGVEAVGTLSTSKSRFLLAANPIINVVPTATGVIGRDSEWASARVRTGYLVSPETLAYGFVGYTRVHSSLTTAGALALFGAAYNQTYNRSGVEIGGGVETWVSQAVTMRAEYGFADLEKVAIVREIPALGTLKHRQSTGMVAAAYHF